MWLYWVSLVFSIIIMFTLVCCRTVARTVPINYTLLTFFTVFEAYIVSVACAFYNADIVLIAAVMTLGMFLALTLYACFTKTDFTACGGIIFCFIMVMFILGIM